MLFESTTAWLGPSRLHASEQVANVTFRFISGQHAGMVRDLDADTTSPALNNLRASRGDHQTDRGVYYDSAA